MATASQFSVQITPSTSSNSLRPSVEWYCQQDQFCTYSVASYANQSFKAKFADVAQYRSNLATLGASFHEIIIDDASGLTGETCTAPDCSAILHRLSRNSWMTPSCPIGTEMVVTISGPVGNLVYFVSLPPRVKLVGDVPSTCVLANGGYNCQPGEITMRFTQVQSPCELSLGGGEVCPFPRTGEAFGTCIANEPCLDSRRELNIFDGLN